LEDVSSTLDSEPVRIGAYLLVTVATLAMWLYERSLRRHRASAVEPRQDPLWPLFWMWSTLLIAALAWARVLDLGDLFADMGRRRFRDLGLYDVRRTFQAVAVAAIMATWLVTSVVMIWRVPARRRRYLPSALFEFTLMCYIGVRALSLHQIDSLLYRHQFHGVRYVTVFELVLLAACLVGLAAVITLGVPIVLGPASEPTAADRVSVP
jgi:hypothetical protein